MAHGAWGIPRGATTAHEELAAFMATAQAKFSGEVGVCMATSGPGAIHLLNGLYDAKADHQPVVAIVGQQARAALGGDYHARALLHGDPDARGIVMASMREVWDQIATGKA
jgi:thiamine pyrophosphate-dependent acetolactate synthase large subunit-like protein